MVVCLRRYRLAAGQQHAEAQCTLGCCYLSGATVKAGQGGEGGEGGAELAEAAGRRAIELFEAAAAAGVPEAQFNLGWCFLRGQFVAVDLPRATRYFEQAADRGDVAAQCRLAEIYTHRDKDKGGGAVSAGQIGRPGCECDVLAGLSGCWAEYQKSQGRK